VRQRSASVDGVFSTAGTVNAGEKTVNHVALRTRSELTSRVGKGSFVGLVTIIVSLCITLL